jgi:hypothetical protein
MVAGVSRARFCPGRAASRGLNPSMCARPMSRTRCRSGSSAARSGKFTANAAWLVLAVIALQTGECPVLPGEAPGTRSSAEFRAA